MKLMPYVLKWQQIYTACMVEELSKLKELTTEREQQRINQECQEMYKLIKLLQYCEEKGVEVDDLIEVVKRKEQSVTGKLQLNIKPKNAFNNNLK